MTKQDAQKSPSQPAQASVPIVPQLQTRPFAQLPNSSSEAPQSTTSEAIEVTEPKTSFSFDKLSVFSAGETPIPPPNGKPIQTKLTIGEPGDKYEQEADQVADQVVQQINSPQAAQREEEIQRSPISVMRSPLQRQSPVPIDETHNNFESDLNRARSGGTSLEPTVKGQMESAMGADFSAVKIHTDTQANQLSQSIQAKAFTTGSDVFFKQGEYSPNSQSGQTLLAHELTHVVQQTGASVQRKPDNSAPHLDTPEISDLSSQNNKEIQRTFDATMATRMTLKPKIEKIAQDNGIVLGESNLNSVWSVVMKIAKNAKYMAQYVNVEWHIDNNIYNCQAISYLLVYLYSYGKNTELDPNQCVGSYETRKLSKVTMTAPNMPLEPNVTDLGKENATRYCFANHTWAVLEGTQLDPITGLAGAQVETQWATDVSENLTFEEDGVTYQLTSAGNRDDGMLILTYNSGGE
ncbi:MAG: DUF4157 domain-containing protein [Cyanobacteria bacterium J06621_11]